MQMETRCHLELQRIDCHADEAGSLFQQQITPERFNLVHYTTNIANCQQLPPVTKAKFSQPRTPARLSTCPRFVAALPTVSGNIETRGCIVRNLLFIRQFARRVTSSSSDSALHTTCHCLFRQIGLKADAACVVEAAENSVQAALFVVYTKLRTHRAGCLGVTRIERMTMNT